MLPATVYACLPVYVPSCPELAWSYLLPCNRHLPSPRCLGPRHLVATKTCWNWSYPPSISLFPVSLCVTESCLQERITTQGRKTVSSAMRPILSDNNQGPNLTEPSTALRSGFRFFVCCSLFVCMPQAASGATWYNSRWMSH